jgi:uncharacterized protein
MSNLLPRILYILTGRDSRPEKPNGPEPAETEAEPDVNALLTLGDKSLASEDFQAAISFYVRAANRGHSEAAVQAGAIYEHRLKSYGEALTWYRRAADQGSAAGQFCVGVFYRDGLTLQRDFREAAKWTRMAADQGHSEAQFNLGVMYLRGDGVSLELPSAVRWLEMAAGQGNVNAQKALYTLAQQGLYQLSKLQSFPFRPL